MKNQFIRNLLWALPCLIYAQDASAWGLFTHIHFAQYIVLACPILDPKLRNAVKNFPQLVIAGACLPDLALISKRFSTTHYWQQAEQVLAEAQSDEEIAIAIGYISHLYVDIVAHNHFVPTFEAKWLNDSLITHVVSEWAMDAHIAKHIQKRPYHLIVSHLSLLSNMVSRCFSISDTEAKKSLKRLAYADRLLRFSQLSRLCLMMIKQRDDEFVSKLDYYLNQTHDALQQFETVLNGQMPVMAAELHHMSANEMILWREKCLIDARLRLSTLLHIEKNHQEQIQTII